MEKQKNNLSIPASILLAGFVIAGGVYLSNNSKAPEANTDTIQQQGAVINPVSQTDHILGNPDAPIAIIEFSDTGCSYCKIFQTNMQDLMSIYGKDGHVSWIYRHFPLDSLHSKSRKEAEATECVNELGGNMAFWKMLDAIYANTSTNNGLDLSKLSEFAKDAGVDVAKFTTCLNSGKYASVVEAYFQDGVKGGVRGTPYSIMILKNSLSSGAEKIINAYILKNNLSQNIKISPTKKEIALNGALPVEIMTTIIDAILK